MNNKIKIPVDVTNILNKLHNGGYEAYVVGGCVRDTLIGKQPQDWDIATSATPQDVKTLFEHTYNTGIEHGTVTVVVRKNRYEVTTYRIESEYLDFRRPSKVEFSKSIVEDLGRRDFTINAIAYNGINGIVDPFNGTNDIKNKIIRCVGNAEERFNEDALRMLRAIRFVCQLDFEIEDRTFQGIVNNKQLITKVAKERIREELTKMLISDNPQKLELMHEAGILEIVLPEFELCMITSQNNPYHIYNVGKHTLEAVKNVEKDSILRWTMLLHDIAKPLCKTTDEKGIDHFLGHQKKGALIGKEIMRNLRFDSKSSSMIERLIKWHDREILLNEKAVRRAIISVGEDIFSMLLNVKDADAKASNPIFMDNRLNNISIIRDIYDKIKIGNHCISIRDLAIDGEDLKGAGIKQGKEIGIILSRLLDIVVENPDKNNKDVLIEFALQIYSTEFTNKKTVE